jgi:hypothetical protein
METKEVYKAIATVTRALGRAGISKDRKNEQQGYKFRGIDDIYNALSSELAEANLCIIPRVMARECVERMSGNNRALFYVTIHAEYDIVSAIDGSMHTASAYGEAMDSGDKATNKAMSAAYKYMAMQLFCIPTEGDNDADGSTHEVQARGATFTPVPRPQAAPAPTNGDAPICDVCGAAGRLGKDGKSYFCPQKDKHDGKWHTIPSEKAS